MGGVIADASSVLGSLPTWILVAIALAAAWRVSLSGGGSAVSELEKANKVLERALHDERVKAQEKYDELGAQVRDLRIENAELRGKTDVALAINEWGTGHERRAQERHEAALVVLDLIARRLGPDPNGSD